MNIPIKDLAVRKCPFQNRRTVLRSRHSLRLDLEDAAALFRKRYTYYPKSAYPIASTLCRRDSNPCGRGLRGLSASPSPRRAYCPDDPSGNSVPPSSRRCSYRRSDRRRTRRFRMSRHYIPKNLRNVWVSCRRIRTLRPSYRQKDRCSTIPYPLRYKSP